MMKLSRYWKVFRNGEMIIPSIGKRVHYIEESNGPCCAAELVDFISGDTDDATTIVANVLAYDPDQGLPLFASGVALSGVSGPDFPNWHYTNHESTLVP